MKKPNSKIIRFATILLLFVIIFLYSCGNNEKNTEELLAKEKVVRIAITGNVTTLDPQESSATLTAQIIRSVYETLLNTDGSPNLANSWEVSENGLAWTFNLRQNVYFHNGELMTTKDVIASFNRIRFSDSDSPYYKSLDFIQDIIAIDNVTLKFILKYNKVDIPLIFADNQFIIKPSSLIDKGHNFSLVPVGTGPFQFVEWKNGEKISLSKYSNFHDTPALVDKIEFFFMTELTTQIHSLIKGDIDIVPYVIAPELNVLKKYSNLIKVLAFPSSTISLIALNNERPPLDSKEFRKAVAMSIDKESTIDLAYPGGSKINFFWPRNTVYYKEVPEHYDPQAARKIFEKYNFGNKLVITVPENFQPHVRAAQLYQAQLAYAGLETEIRKVSWAVWIDQVYTKSQYDMTVIGHTGRLTPFLRLQSFIEDGGYVRWHNTEFQALSKALSVSSNEKSRIEIYKKMFELMTTEYPFVYISQLSINIAMNNKISGLKFDPILEAYDFRKISVNEE